MVNKKYYGWKLALYIAGIFYIAIVITALTLHWAFASFSVLPEAAIRIMSESPFQLDYTFWFNLVFVIVAGFGVHLYRKLKQSKNTNMSMMKMEGDSKLKTAATWICLVYLTIGVVAGLMG